MTLGFSDPAFSSLLRLEYVLRGICRASPGHLRPQHLPVTPQILRLVFNMFTAANITGCSDVVGSLLYRFFGFLCGKMFTGSAQEEPSLTASDVSVDSHSSPSFVSLHLHHSKTDTFGVGVRFFLSRFDGLICPVKLLLSFLAARGSTPGHLFQFRDGSPLSCRRLVEAVHHALEVHGLDIRQFNGHSFWIGVATIVGECPSR